jgi:hypothetical protein
MAHDRRSIRAQAAAIMRKKTMPSGTKRHELKQNARESGGDARHIGVITSTGTQKAYTDRLTYYGEWAKSTHGVNNISAPDAGRYATEFLQTCEARGMSPWSIQSYRSALRMVYGADTAADYTAPAEARENITRGRYDTARSRHFSEARNADLVNFCCSTGLRRSELEHLTGGCASQHADGNWYIDSLRTATGSHTKGGRDRDVRIIGTPAQIAATVERINGTPSDALVWGRVHSAANIHSYRATYACTYYKQAYTARYGAYDGLRNQHVDRSDAYHCRGDMSGITLSRSALVEVSHSMGHSRAGVIVESYIYQEFQSGE